MSGWTEEGLTRAWRALARQEAAENWRFVHLADMGTISVEAGCNFPLGREALIVSFPGSQPVNRQGFLKARASTSPASRGSLYSQARRRLHSSGGQRAHPTSSP